MIKNWLIRGDTHGNFHWMVTGSLDQYNPDETAIIILGDGGFNFYLNKMDARNKKEVNAREYLFYCVRGNHEARPQDIPGMQLVWDENVNGEIYIEPQYPNIRYFKDFGEYKINNYTVAVIGGAYSVDKWYRLSRYGITSKLDPDYTNSKKTGWFHNEQLSSEEMKAAAALFRGKTYDFVFSHTCPLDWQPTDLFLSGVNQSEVDNSMELWMMEVRDSISWGIWCFGHYHRDRLERPHVEQYFNDLENLDALVARWEEYDKTGQIDWWLTKSPNFYMT